MNTLKATAHGAPWADSKNKIAIVFRAATDVDSNLYWRQLYVVLRTVFLALLVLQTFQFQEGHHGQDILLCLEGYYHDQE